ncbi:MAG: VOC family protein [Anaerolineae bacterium]|nr:VOC family protein [Anaerolineae bacterium]
MTQLYPSWIEIPVHELDRALAFYRAVFDLAETPQYDDSPDMRIAVLLASDKALRAPGVSLVQSPAHVPSSGGALINFYLGDHAALEAALVRVTGNGGSLVSGVIDEGDGQRYTTVRDPEGNTLALSSYEPIDGEE